MSSGITLVEDSHELLRNEFPEMNCFRIKRGEETVGRCVGFVCTDWRRFRNWLQEFQDFEIDPDVQGLSLPIGVLQEIRVFDKFRRKNYATLALAQFLNWCFGMGCSDVMLNAASTVSAPDLVRMYEKSGFNVLCDSGLGKFMVWTKPA